MEQQFVTKSGGIARFYERIARFAFLAMVALVPLTFIPWTVDGLEINKQTLVLACTAIAVIAWLGMMVVRKKFFFKKSVLFIVPMLLIVSVGVSSLLSLAPYTSWLGQGTQEYLSFFSVMAFVLIFVVGAHFLSETSVQKWVWWLSTLVSSVVGINILFGMFGFPIFTTNFIGTPNALGIYLLVMMVVGCSLLLVDGNTSASKISMDGAMGLVQKISIFVTSFSAIVVLLSIDYWVLWIAALIGVGTVFTFALVRAQEFPQTSRFILPMILFVISLLFLFLPSFLSGIFSVEVAPSFSSSFQVAQQSISDSSLMFGSGPGTYAIDYAKFAPADINASNFWDVRFDRAGSHLLTILASWGIVGALLLVLFLVSLFALSIKELVSKREHDEWKMTFVAFSGWLVLAFSMFVYSSNFTLTFMFWFLSAVLASQIGPTIRQWEFSKNPRFGLMTAFLFVVVNVVLLTMVFMSVSRYAAEVSFAKAVQSDRTNAPIDSIIKELDTAARLNKLSDVYYRNLGNALLVKAGEMLEDPEMDTSTLKEVIGLSINAAKRSTEISPSNVVNWHLLGDVYREVSPIVANADLFSISAYQNATLLAPNNPKYRTALARAYLVRAESLATLLGSEDEVVVAEADTKMQEAYSLAVLELEKAISLKSDYAAAHYYLSIAYERQGNLGEAISKMEAVRSVAYNDIGVALQLGLLYLRQGKTTEARIELERAVSIAPNFSNAMWYLSYVYEQEGDLQKAIEQIEKIRELNPENPLIDQRLSDLQNGFVAQTLPEPLEEDSENIVEEIQEVIAE